MTIARRTGDPAAQTRRRRCGAPGEHWDPFLRLVEYWARRERDFSELSPELAGAVRLCRKELLAELHTMEETEVPYPAAAAATGFSLGSLKNNPAVPNVGTRGCGAFRLKDLPFKAGMAPPGRQYTALRQLRQPRTMTPAERRVRRTARYGR